MWDSLFSRQVRQSIALGSVTIERPARLKALDGLPTTLIPMEGVQVFYTREIVNLFTSAEALPDIRRHEINPSKHLGRIIVEIL